jgi:hypothetical protein
MRLSRALRHRGLTGNEGVSDARVAQLDRALASGAKGRRFESCRVHWSGFTVKTLVDIAVEAGLISRADAARAGRTSEQRSLALVVALRDAGVDELALLGALRKATRVKALDPESVRSEAEALRLVPREICRRHRVLPIAVSAEPGGGRVLRIAMADPTDADAIAEVAELSGCDIEVHLLPLSAIEELTEHGFRGLHTQVRARRPFGEGVAPATEPHARASQVGEDTAIVPATVPFHAVTDEADVGLRLRALVRLLESKGLLAEGELDAAVIDLMRAGSGSHDDE